ncbi:MAG: VanZ family protein [Candidatus Zixiibacteriota bacterium]|nr:MAG: VanZ family protein [candidate division Zixibacteria bacterium]
MYTRILTVILILVVAATIVGSRFLDLPNNGRLWGEVQNFAHMPYFGLLSLAFLALSRRLLSSRVNSVYTHYIIAFFVAASIGLVDEIVQIASPRDADITDWLRDIGGSLSFLGLHLSLDRRTESARSSWPPRARELIISGSALIIIVVSVPVGLWSWAFIQRNSTFPEICGFESYWENRFVTAKHAGLSITPVPPTWKEARGEHVGRVTFYPADFPGFAIEEPYPDWSGYRFFSFRVFSELDKPRTLTVRVEDFEHTGDITDRFTGVYTVLPGDNEVNIPIAEIRVAPAARDLDISAVRAINFYLKSPKDSIALYFDNIAVR